MINIKTLKPVGVIIILSLSVIAIIMCFTVDLGVPERYESVHDASYYSRSRETMEELKKELEENVFPNLDGITDCYVAEDTNRLVITISSSEYDKMTAVLLRDFDESLFVFLKGS